MATDQMELLGFDDSDRLTETHKGWVEEALEGDGHVRDERWSESIAVGSKSFVERIKEKLESELSKVLF